MPDLPTVAASEVRRSLRQLGIVGAALVVVVALIYALGVLVWQQQIDRCTTDLAACQDERRAGAERELSFAEQLKRLLLLGAGEGTR